MKTAISQGRPGRLLILVGALTICCALGLFGYNRWVDWRAGERSRAVLDSLPAPAISLDINDIDPKAAMPAVEVDSASYCATLSLPARGIDLPIADTYSTDQLALTPCRYAGSLYGDSLVLVGMDFDTQFGPFLSLSGGEDLLVSDMLGNEVAYRVDSVQVLQPMSIERALEPQADSGAGLYLVVCDVNRQARAVVYCCMV